MSVEPAAAATTRREAPPPSGLGRDAVYGALALGVERTVALGIALYLPRHLGLDDYGRYAFLLSYLGFFQIWPDASLEAVLVTRVARAASGEALALAGRGALVRLGVSLTGAALGIAVLGIVAGDRATVVGAMVASVGFAATAATPYRVVLRARLSMARYVGLLAAQSAIALGCLGTVIARSGGLVPVLGAVSAGPVAGVVIGRILVGAGARPRRDAHLARALVADAWPLAATSLALVGAQQALQVLLLRLHGTAAMGLLGGAQKLVEAIGLLPQALMLSVLPALSLAAASGGAAKAARDACRALVVILVPVAAAVAIWAGPVLRVVLGPAFAPAAPVLRALAPAAVLGASGAVLANLLLSVGLQRTLLRTTAVAAVFIGVLGAVLVPRLGAVGVAVTWVTGMVAGQAILVLPRATRVHVAPVLAGLAGPLVLGAGAVAIVVALGAPFVAGVAVLGIAYPAALLATGTVTRADLVRWLG